MGLISLLERKGRLRFLVSSLSACLAFPLPCPGGPAHASSSGVRTSVAGRIVRLGEESPSPGAQSYRLLFCGDLIFHKGVKRCAMFNRRCGAGGKSLNNEGFDVPLYPLRRLTALADLAFCNLECPLVHPPAGDPYCMKTRGAFWFKAPPAAARAIRDAGFDLVSTANNHIDNAGTEGLLSTIEILSETGLLSAGTGENFEDAHSPVLVRLGKLELAFLAYCSSRLGRDPNSDDPSRPHVCRCEPGGAGCARLWLDLSRARRMADLVVLSFHWGPREYTRAPDPGIVRFARLCAEKGADVIVGHHPHVLHPIEKYRASDGRVCVIMYSLGNLLSNQSPSYSPLDPSHDEDAARRREGVAVLLRVERRSGVSGPVIRSCRLLPLWTDNNWRAYKAGREPAMVRVVSIPDEIRRLKARIGFLKERARRIERALEAGLPARSGAADLSPLPGPP